MGELGFLFKAKANISLFGEDDAGEIYLIDHSEKFQPMAGT